MTYETMTIEGIEVVDGWHDTHREGAGDRRRYARYPVDLSGKILLDDDRRLDCRVVDFSAHGMRLLHLPAQSANDPHRESQRDRQEETRAGGSRDADRGPGESAGPALAVHQGDLISIIISLPVARRRIRATAQVRRLAQLSGPVEVGIQYARINLDVYRSLMQEADERRFQRAHSLSPRELATAVSNPWQHTALLLESAVTDYFTRVTERLKLHAEFADESTEVGAYYYALVGIKARQGELASQLVRRVYGEITGRPRDIDEDEQTTLELPELDPRAPAYKWDLERIGCSTKPFSARLLNAEHSPLAPAALTESIEHVCADVSTSSAVRSVFHEVAAEVARLHFARLQRILRPIAWGEDGTAVRRKRRPSIDLDRPRTDPNRP